METITHPILEKQEKWDKQASQALSTRSLKLLLANRIPAVRIPGFATPEECRAFSEALKTVPLSQYEDVSPPIGRIGITQFESRRVGKQKYFSAVQDAEKIKQEIFRKSFDPCTRISELIRIQSGYEVETAFEKDYGHYYSGLIRQINEGTLLHVDVAALDAPEWDISQINSQLAWNLYLQIPDEGGDCVVYNRPWNESDNAFKIRNSYGYDMAIVEGVEEYRIKPKLGEVVIFNCRNYHHVSQAKGRRLTIGSFIGESNPGKLLLWS